MGNSPELLWESCLKIIQENVSAQQYNTWFKPITCQSFKDCTLTVQVPSQFVYEYLEEHFVVLLRSVITRIYGKGTRLTYCIIADKTNNITVDYEATQRPAILQQRRTTKANKAPDSMASSEPQDLDPHINPNYNFDNFIEGASNKLPCTVAHAVAEHPSQTTFNPLFIFGPSGVGKTHLLNAIGTKIKELFPTKRVLYVSAHLFQVQYTDSVRNNTVNDFINFYQTIDVLLLDDIQEFAALSKTQNTFFHIFNHLHLNGRQLVLTSDRPPIALQGMEERLITRFKWGLLAELERPNEELRRAILKSKIQRDGLNIPDEVIHYIAANISDSVRDLEGVVNALMANSVVYNCNIDLKLAERVISRTVKIDNKAVTVDKIIHATCTHFQIKPDDIFTESRKRAVVQVRQIAMYLASKHTKLSLANIGARIGKRDHATVLHSCNIVEGRLGIDKSFKAEVEAIEQDLRH
jgi:chromosomal replication initiator protein